MKIFKLMPLLLIINFLVVTYALAQDKTATPGNFSSEQEDNRIAKLDYDIRLKFPLNVTLGYRMDEETEYERMYEDSSKYSFKRTYTYFFRLVCKQSPSDGLQKITVFIDSLTYHFKDDKRETSFHNSQDRVPPLNRVDFLKTFIPNSLVFDMYYDYYGGVVKLDGLMLEAKRNDITDPIQGFKNNPRMTEFYLNRMSQADLTHIVDLAKRLLPQKKAKKDSLWKTNFDFDINYETYSTLASVKFTKLVANHYYIEAVADSMILKNKKFMVEDLKEEAKAEESFASGKLSLKISTSGILKYLTSEFEAQTKAHVKNTPFTEKIKTQTNWTQTGMWR